MFASGLRFNVAAAALMAGGLLVATPASAQATRTWISGVGDDVNPCSRTAPCKTFAGAISKTAASGTINCLDPGGFGAVTITKSITLSCEIGTAGVLVSGTNGIIINAGANDVVRIYGLDLDGLASVGGSTNGINFLNGGALYVSHTRINGFGGSGSGGFGISFTPTNGNATLVIENVALTRNGNAAVPAGSGAVLVKPAAGMTAKVSISNSVIAQNINVGVRADTTGIVGSGVDLAVSNSVLVNNGAGLLAKAPAATGTVTALVDNASVLQNASAGIFANGPGVVARVGNSAINGNGTGVSAAGGATLSSYGSNQLNGNTTDGAFSGTIAPQ